MNEDLETFQAREQFEAWATADPRDWDTDRLRRNDGAWPGQYVQYHVQCAWEAWLFSLSQEK